jgi:anti-sigma-K factor RskA
VPHLDETTLALIALGETSDRPDDAVHLSSCARCRAEVEQLASVVAIGRSITDDDYPVRPRPEVWQRVVSGIREDDVDAEPEAVGVVDLEPRRRSRTHRRRLVSLGVAAAVGLVLGAGGTWMATRSEPAPLAQGQVTVSALQPHDTPGASGTVVLHVVSQTQRTVDVAVSNLPAPPATFYEVWLMDPTDAHLVSLGVLGADGRGAYIVPVGLDLAQYSAVDVSLQPMNGSPAHSQVSAVRGFLVT